MLIGVELDGSSEGDDFVELRSKSISLGCKIEATTSLSQPNHSPFYQLNFQRWVNKNLNYFQISSRTQTVSLNHLSINSLHPLPILTPLSLSLLYSSPLFPLSFLNPSLRSRDPTLKEAFHETRSRWRWVFRQR